jgi:hypothetical protein
VHSMSNPTFLHLKGIFSIIKRFTNQPIGAILSNLLTEMDLFGINFLRLQDRD